MAAATLTIGEVAERTGVPVPTLRVWERRFGFPAPSRTPSGHRLYTEDDCERLRQVVAEREAGRSLASAIDRVRDAADAVGSVAAHLRARPGVPPPSLLTRRTMTALSHAIEDEASAAAGRPVLVAAFQAERAYRRAEHRWRDLAAGAELAAVAATFDRPGRPGRSGPGPVRLRLAADSPLRHEWVVACHGPTFAACLAGWERPTPPATPDGDRLFEAVWTVDPAVARSAVAFVLGAGTDVEPSLLAAAEAALDRPLRPEVGDAPAAIALANRMVAYAAR